MNTSITEKITIKENKILKLSNVLVKELSKDEFTNLDKVIYMMESYIKSKGNLRIGPLVTYSDYVIDNDNIPDIKSKLMLQMKNPLNKIDNPYKFESLIRITNCLMARYIEKEKNLQFAYSKLNLYAFENSINLKGGSYTVFVNQNEDILIADVFMECHRRS